MFDPFDLTRIEVRYQGRSMGQAVPHRIGRHVHAKARPDATPPPAAPTGIDYLRLVEARHTAELAEKLRYADLPPNTTADPFTDHAQVPGQLDLTQLPELADPDPDQTGEAR